MVEFIKKYHVYFWVILIIAICIYQPIFSNKFKKSYKTEGLYTIGKINEIKPYGRGTGSDFVYTFKVNNKEYESQTDIGQLSFYKAKMYKDKYFLVVYLKSDIHVNRMYISIPISERMTESQLKNYINNNSDLKKKLDSIPFPSWFWENYF